MTLSRLPTRCKHCKVRFLPEERGLRIHPACVDDFLAALRAKNLRDLERKERAERKVRKAALKTRREWIAEAQIEVNKYVRLRDLYAGRGCISCGARPEQKFGGAYDAGHFRSVGSAPHLRFLTTQIRLQCVRCNRHLGGNVVEYRKGLVALIGGERVEAIEAMQGVAKWDVDYLRRLKAVMAKRARRLEKRLENEK